MPTTQAALGMATPNGDASLVRKTLLMSIKLYDEAVKDPKYKRIVGKILTTSQAYEESVSSGGIVTPSVTPEWGNIAEDDIRQAYSKRHVYQKYALKVTFSDEALINDQYNIVSSHGKLLKTSFEQAKEMAAAKFLNGGWSTSILTLPHAKSLFASDHPLASDSVNGTTDTNVFTTAQTLGVIALEDATAALLNQKAHKGLPMPSVGPFVLMCANKNRMVAKRIIGATNLPGTNNNDPNPVSGDISEVITSPYFTNPEWWMLRSASNDGHKLFMLQRYAFKLVGAEYSMDNDTWKAMAKEGFLVDAMDWRGTFGSNPS